MHSRRAAFTLVELLIAAAVSVILAGIIYTVGSEALISFGRNISINRSYSDARLSLERISTALDSAGHVPVLVDSTGLVTTGPAAGVRFYRYSYLPTYQIPSGNSGSTSLALTIAAGQSVPAIGDLAVIGQIGFQGTAISVSCAITPGTPNTTGAPVPATLTFASTITSGCVPALSASQDFTYVAGDSTKTPPKASNSFSCQIFTQVAFIAVPPAAGTSAGVTQLRYYRRAMSANAGGTAGGGLSNFNGATVFNDPGNFKVIASLPLNATSAQILPFQMLSQNAPTLNIVLCAEGPDYNKRNLGTANTFTKMQTSLGSRCPLLVSRNL